MRVFAEIGQQIPPQVKVTKTNKRLNIQTVSLSLSLSLSLCVCVCVCVCVFSTKFKCTQMSARYMSLPPQNLYRNKSLSTMRHTATRNYPKNKTLRDATSMFTLDARHGSAVPCPTSPAWSENACSACPWLTYLLISHSILRLAAEGLAKQS